MTYATRADIEALWGEQFLLNTMPADIVDDPAQVSAAIAGALTRASEEVDAHLSARYTVPFAVTPRVLVSPAANIAIYILANRHGALTKTLEDRYEQATKLLQRIAEGKAGLGADEPRVSTDPDTSTGGASFTANRRLFDRGLD